jgi:hypothetical protein
MNFPIPDVLSIVVSNVLGFIVQRVICRGVDTYTEYREEQIRLEPMLEEYRSLPRVVSIESLHSGSEPGWICLNGDDL